MPAYVPDPTDATQPLDSVKASTAAAEFRALKAYIAGSGGGGGGGNGATNLFAQTSLTVAAGAGQSLVGPVTFSGTLTVHGRLVIL